jgi:sugar phosphate permease
LNPAPPRILLPDSLSLSLWILRRPSFLLPPMRCWQSEIPLSPCAMKTSAGRVQKTRTILLEKLVLNKALWYLYLCKSFIKIIQLS